MLYFYTGDFFRKLWGPYAGWTQSVSVILAFSNRWSVSFMSPYTLSICYNHRVSLSVLGAVLCRPQEVPKAKRSPTSDAAEKGGRR